jgi:hypothetical protein
MCGRLRSRAAGRGEPVRQAATGWMCADAASDLSSTFCYEVGRRTSQGGLWRTYAADASVSDHREQTPRVHAVIQCGLVRLCAVVSSGCERWVRAVLCGALMRTPSARVGGIPVPIFIGREPAQVPGFGLMGPRD